MQATAAELQEDLGEKYRLAYDGACLVWNVRERVRANLTRDRLEFNYRRDFYCTRERFIEPDEVIKALNEAVEDTKRRLAEMTVARRHQPASSRAIFDPVSEVRRLSCEWT